MERRSFQFFRYATAPALASDYDADFWFALVFKFCHFEGAVRHAVLALSCLHETLVRPGLSIQALAGMKVFALQQYNLAISSLTKRLRCLDPSEVIAPLLTSILFICMEFMQRKDTESLEFIHQGRHLLLSLTRSKSINSHNIDIVRQHIAPMYVRVGLTALIFGHELPPVPAELDIFTEMPTTFSMVAEARHHLYAAMDALLRWRFNYKLAQTGPSGTPASKDMQTIFLSRLSRWNTAFALLTATLPIDKTPVASSSLLQIFYYLAKIMTATTTAVEQTDYDRYVDSFSAILPLGAKYLAHLSSANVCTAEDEVIMEYTSPITQTTRPGINLPAFSFEPGVVPALYFTAVKCRHPQIRRAAVDLLSKYGTVQESLWKAHVVGCVAAHFIEVETDE